MALAACLIAGTAAWSQSPPVTPETWPAMKCQRYKQAYAQAITRQGKARLGPEFLAAHDAFLASDCSEHGRVCPRSTEELALANTLVVLAMNQGMASTFLPFACRKAP